LDVPTGFLGWLSYDRFGRMLYAHLRDNGVDLRYVGRSERPTALSFVSLGAGSEPSFAFYGQGTADTELAPERLPTELADDLVALHFGSLAAAREPSATALTALVEREHQLLTVSFDPNVRPGQLADRAAYVHRLEGWLGMVDLVKVSRSDLHHLYPGVPYPEAAAAWAGHGPGLVVVTLGAEGAEGFSRGGRARVDAVPVGVVDTVGAGDAFTAGLLAALFDHGWLEPARLAGLSSTQLRSVLSYANLVAALTCTRRGADPPRRRDVEGR
ncbi:MAG: carbohydrate kinase family protein, partial [Candidatus Bipolaricaulaceae bacterium]